MDSLRFSVGDLYRMWGFWGTMRVGLLCILLAAVVGACAYDVTGPDAETEGTALTTDVATADGGFVPAITGIDVFHQTVEPITIVCSAITVNLDYRTEATNRLNAALAEISLDESLPSPTSLTFDELKLLLRCHQDTDLSGYCVTQARLTGEIVYPEGTGGASPVSFEAVADDRADGSFTCSPAAESVRRSVETVLDTLLATIRDGATTATAP